MASNNEDTGHSSDSTHDFTCTKCDKGNKASHFCPVCNVYYCVSCLQFLCVHGILGRNEVSRWGAVAPTTTSTEVECLRHPGRPIQVHCSVHDVVCCRLCSARSHRSCQTKYIEDVDTNSVDDGEIPKIREEMKQIKETIRQLKGDRQSRKSTLGKFREDCEEEVRDYCHRLRDLVDSLESKTLEELKATTETRNAKFQSDIEVCEQMEKELDHITSPEFIEQLDQEEKEVKGEKANIFIRIKRDKEWLYDNTLLVVEMDKEQTNEGLKVVLDTTIETALSTPVKVEILKRGISSWQAKNKKEFNVRLSQEHSNCEVENIVQLSNGNFVIVDYTNKSVKQLNKDYGVISFLSLTAIPVDICCVSASEVAVSLNNKTIQFITVGNSLTPTRSISLDHTCRGVACKNGNLYVTDNSNSVYVYSLTGSRLQTFSKDKNGEDMFGTPYRITFSRDGNLMYITDKKFGLVTMDTHGNKLSTFQSPDLKQPDGVCVAEDGSVFVSEYSTSKNVIQVTPGGDKKVTEVVPKSAGVMPHGICTDRNNGKLLVSNCGKDELCVFDLSERDSYIDT